MASARSCFSTVRTALGKLRITGLPAPFDVARSFPQFLRPLPLQPTVLTSKRRSRFGIRKAPNHVPPPHLPDDPYFLRVTERRTRDILYRFLRGILLPVISSSAATQFGDIFLERDGGELHSLGQGQIRVE